MPTPITSFVEGTLEDEKGFCAVVTTQDIAKQDYILTPGRYVGIEEQEDDDDNQEESLVNGTLHFGNGGTDKAGIVESIRVRHIVGKVFFHLLHTFVHGIGYLDMVGSG